MLGFFIFLGFFTSEKDEKINFPPVVLNDGHYCACDWFCHILPTYVILQVDLAQQGRPVVLLKYFKIPMWTLPWIGVIRDTIKQE